MQPIRLSECRVARHTVQQERDQFGSELDGQQRKSLAELFGISDAVIGRYSHAEQQHTRLGFPASLDNGGEIALHVLDRQAAQAVVGAEFEDDDGRLVFGEGRRDAAQPATGGFAADTGIDHAPARFLLRQLFLQQTHPACFAWNAVSGRQAVTEHQYGLTCHCRQRQ